MSPWAELMRDMLRARVHAPACLPCGLCSRRGWPKAHRPAKHRPAKHRPGHNLPQRLKTFQTETLRFLTDFDAPFTNNLAEQDLRMMKVKMKISGAFRTLQGAQIFATLRSVVSTARKQGRNVLQTLAEPPNHIIMNIAP
jgi:hypothetical protein